MVNVTVTEQSVIVNETQQPLVVIANNERGKNIELQNSGTQIQWRVQGTATWYNLIAVEDLTGPQGEQGEIGDTGPVGADGPTVEFSYNSTHLLYRPVGSGTWLNAIPLANITGPSIEMQAGTTHLQYRVTGASTWIDIIAKSALTGATGATGAIGATGATGADGSKWHSGDGFGMVGGLGQDGDFYLNDTNGDVYEKIAGTWSFHISLKGADGADGADGNDGADGALWHSGAGAPAGGTGSNGDFYLNVTNGDVYEKAGGSWSSVGNIKGPTGTTGATGSTGATGPTGPTGAAGENGNFWYSSSGSPSGGTGANGDYHLNTAQGIISKKASGTWATECDLAAVIVGISGSGTLGSLTWGGTAPTGITKTYKYAYIGKLCMFSAMIDCTGAGVSNTDVEFTLPSGLGIDPDLFIVANEFQLPGAGLVSTNGTSNFPAQGRAVITRTGVSTYKVQVSFSSANVKKVYCSFSYVRV